MSSLSSSHHAGSEELNAQLTGLCFSSFHYTYFARPNIPHMCFAEFHANLKWVDILGDHMKAMKLSKFKNK
jgi:hypothetical protein